MESAATVENPNDDGTVVVHLTEPKTQLSFPSAPPDAQVSFLRGFSAPVRVRYRRPAAALRQLALNDSDGFARWDAAQELVARALLARAGAQRSDTEATLLEDHVAGLFQDLGAAAARAPDDGEAKALFALLLTLPEETALLERAPGTDILAIAGAWDALADRLAVEVDWLALADGNATPGPYRAEAAAMARRKLRHRALWYALRELDRRDPVPAERMLGETLDNADNLTDRLAAFTGLLGLRSLSTDAKDKRVAQFYERWASEALVVNAWFAAQARCPLPGGIDRVAALERHAAFDKKNPDKVRSVFGAFTRNVRNFHAEGGAGYRWLAERVRLLDPLNPQVASVLAKRLTEWPRFDAARARALRDALRFIGERDISKDVREVVDKGLADAPD